jgi:4-amino-4-deoxy-L-arabinose transferase-like glycosyltransferase
MSSDWMRWPGRLLDRRWWPAWLWAAAALAIVANAWFEARAAAAVLLLFFLPGWAWLEAWLPDFHEGVWRIILAAGLSLILTSLGTLYLSYLPGPLTEGQLLVLCAVLTLPPLAIALRRRPAALIWPDRRSWLLLGVVLVLAAAVRLPRLGYAEFHEDEVEVTSLATRTIGGEDYAVFLHRKGPEQMLPPLAGWLLAGRITEGWARLPFALAGLLGVAALTLFAHRLGGGAAGLTTGLLLALNGYFIAFSRMVQYQAIIFFLASLALICWWWALEEGETRLIWPAVLGLVVSLLAHYDALLYLPVAAYLAWRIWQRRRGARPALLVAGLLAAGVLLSFYIPYVRDPQFEQTRTYLVESRVGTAWLYNNLKPLRRLDADYSSRFYLPVLWVLSLAVAVRYKPSGRAWWGLLGGALLAAWTTTRWPDAWHLGGADLSLLPWLALFGVVWLGLRRQRRGYEAVWMWWGVPLLAYGFLVSDPRTHLYVAYPGWTVVAGWGAAWLWQAGEGRRRFGPLRPALMAAGGAAALLVASYQAVIFLPTESALLALRAQWEDSAGEALYGSLPEPRSYFGYPRHVGWKAAGWLVNTGRLPGDFRSAGEDFSVPIWYTFETPRSCYDDPALYMVAHQPQDKTEGATDNQLTARYALAATIYSEGRPRIDLYTRGQSGGAPAPRGYDLADLEPAFDALASPEHFIEGSQPDQALQIRFGDVAVLSGFSLSDQKIAQGATLSLALYWKSAAETDIAYRAFVHLGENPVWGQRDDDPACRLPTSLWRIGQTAVGQFRVTVAPETPPGDYPLVVGLYHPTTMERLPVQDAQGQPAGDSLTLATIRVVRP